MKLLFTSGANDRPKFGRRAPASWRGIHDHAERYQPGEQEQPNSHCQIIPIQTVRPALGGNDTRASRHGAYSTRADLPNSPSDFLRAPIDDDVRERAAKTFCAVVISSAFAIPLMLAGIILYFS